MEIGENKKKWYLLMNQWWILILFTRIIFQYLLLVKILHKYTFYLELLSSLKLPILIKIGSDKRGSILLSDGSGFGKDAIIFGPDMSSSVQSYN